MSVEVAVDTFSAASRVVDSRALLFRTVTNNLKLDQGAAAEAAKAEP